jgi:SAM-dependent methyltransferase
VPDGQEWALGHYEQIAPQLREATEVVLAAAAPRPRERVLDLGCGTGTTALAATATGAIVTGVDPAERLLEIARAAAEDSRAPATFVAGEAAALPFADASVDVVVSVFGVIFAPSAHGAAAELARVCDARARFVFTAWVPEGALAAAASVRRGLLPSAPATGAPFAWHDQESVAALLGPYGFTVDYREHELAFTAASPGAFVDSELAEHPMWELARRRLGPDWDEGAVHEKLVEVFRRANEDPDAFKVSSPYAVLVAKRTS